MGLVAMKCPGCGADIQLDDSREFGFCNFCGTKVMQEKIIVEHQGSVKMDNSEFVQKYLQNARRARNKGDWEEVEKYYNLVEQNDPENIEAVFYSSYGKLRCTLMEDNVPKWNNAFNVLKSSISVLDDYFDMGKEAECKKVLEDVAKDILVLMKATANGVVLPNMSTAEIGVRNRTRELFPQMGETLDNIIKKYKDAGKNYEYLTAMKVRFAPQKQGCYVATAVYGSYDCPEVWTLRRYRDDELAKTWYGRAFIHTYYAISPTLVAWFGHTEWFKKMWKGKLDRMVERLQSEGVESTPYNDKDWR